MERRGLGSSEVTEAGFCGHAGQARLAGLTAEGGGAISDSEHAQQSVAGLVWDAVTT